MSVTLSAATPSLTGNSRMRYARVLCALLLCASSTPTFAATVERTAWGHAPAGEPVDLYTIRDGRAEVSVTTWGARLVSIRVPDRKGTIANVLLSREQADAYTGGAAVMGATIGRYANRIAGGQLTIAGTAYPLSKNNGKNTLHGGAVGFNQKIWTGKPIKDGVEMSLVSPDGDMGFPGEMKVRVRFTLHEDKGNASVRISYAATTSKPTVINLTNHAYFNLGDDPDTPVIRDVAMIAADDYTPVDSTGIPTGAVEPVAGTAFDFRTAHAFAAALPVRGYDNNFVLRSTSLAKPAAEVDDPATGRTLRVYTTEPGLQLFLPRAAPAAAAQPAADGSAAPAPAARPAVQAFCLEAEHFPDSPNHAKFPSTTLEPGRTFRSQTVYVFGVGLPMNSAK